jgi:hypothetical protein
MVQQPTSLPELSINFDERVVPFPTRPAANLPPEIAVHTEVRLGTGQVRTRTIRQVAVLEVVSCLADAVEDLDRAVQLALAEDPRGVVISLSDASQATDPGAVKVLATAGRHVRDWPGIPVVVACPDPQVRETLRAQPLGEHLIVAASLFSAVSLVLAAPRVAVESLRLAAHPTAPRASREFVTRTLMGWQLGRVIPFASLVISELVASSSIDAGTDINLSVGWDRKAVRLTVRDHGPALPGQRPSALYLHGRRLTLVAGLARAFGVMPTGDGGKVVWAVLDAPGTKMPAGPHHSAMERQESLILDEATVLARPSLEAN